MKPVSASVPWPALPPALPGTILLPAALVLALLPSAAEAQRARRAPEPPPPIAEVSLGAMPDAPSPYHRILTVRAIAPIELAADRRLLRLEILPDTAPGARRAARPVRCEHPDRISRVSSDRIRTLQPGESWSEWVDLREYCWGRSLDALRAGGTLTIVFGPRARGRGRFAARAGTDERRELGPVAQHGDPIPAPTEPDPESPVRVVLSPTDARSGAAFTLRVAVLGRSGTRRAYVRPDRVRFTGIGPEGPFQCGITPGGGAAPPDLFQRLTARSGARFSLEGATYCRGAIRSAGVYEITPTVTLDQDGAAYELDAITGTFTGAPSLLRVRRGARPGYVEHAVGATP